MVSTTPPHEVTCMKTRAKIKQVRRMESLSYRLLKYERNPGNQVVNKQLQEEWKMITKCRAFGPSFLHWLYQRFCDFPEVQLPTHAWLHEAMQFVRFHVNACVNADNKLWSKRNTTCDILTNR